jgi:GxxExxY protein
MKAIENLTPVHHAQVLTYLKLTGLRLGLVVNFIPLTPFVPWSLRG